MILYPRTTTYYYTNCVHTVKGEILFFLFSGQFFHQILHMHHMVNSPHICAAENRPVLDISFHGIRESPGNAVRYFCRITFFQTLITFLNRAPSFPRPVDKGIVNCPPRKTYRTLDNDNILFLCIQIGLFECVIKIILYSFPFYIVIDTTSL